MIGLRSILRSFFDSYVRSYVTDKFRLFLLPERMNVAINLLHGMDDEALK